jgi:tetrapyrrole methylase family protein/MazG family protein
MALTRANIKFAKRFKYIEEKCKADGVEMSKDTVNTMEHYWQEAKRGN